MKRAPFLRWLSDQQLLLQIKNGGHEADQATSLLYIRYRRQVLRSIRRYMSGQPRYAEAGEDILHDAYIVMIEKFACGSGLHQSVPAYWLGIARFLYLNRHRKESRVVLVMDPEEGYGGLAPSPEELYLDREAEERLAATFACLEPKCQQMLRLWIERYSMHEIASLMQLSSESMARKIKHVCFRRWKDLLTTRYPGGPGRHAG
jgi:RNA polymerase sigma factor (sigma-70 family)